MKGVSFTCAFDDRCGYIIFVRKDMIGLYNTAKRNEPMTGRRSQGERLEGVSMMPVNVVL
jgi:hypothetical protein